MKKSLLLLILSFITLTSAKASSLAVCINGETGHIDSIQMSEFFYSSYYENQTIDRSLFEESESIEILFDQLISTLNQWDQPRANKYTKHLKKFLSWQSAKLYPLPLKTEISQDDLLAENKMCFLQNMLIRTVQRRAKVPRFLVNKTLWTSSLYLTNLDRAAVILREAIYDDYKRSKIKDKTVIRKFLFNLIMNKFESKNDYLDFLASNRIK